MKDNNLQEAYEAMCEYRRKRAIKSMFAKENLSTDLNDYNHLVRLFCWVKTIICMILKRTNGSYLDSGKFCIVTFDEFNGGEYPSWESVWVSASLFKDWNVCICSDGV